MLLLELLDYGVQLFLHLLDARSFGSLLLLVIFDNIVELLEFFGDELQPLGDVVPGLVQGLVDQHAANELIDFGLWL